MRRLVRATCWALCWASVVLGGGCAAHADASPEQTSSVSIVARPDRVTARVGEVVRFAALLQRRDGAEAVPATWSSTDPRVATVDGNTGVAVGVAPGKVAIEARYGPGTASATLTIVP